DGGETSLENLVTLCRYHHRALHRGEFRIEHGADSELIFIDARYRPTPPAIHPQFGDRHGSG
ncbi:MAG: HNH endonuclease signature motif containing protein, partial [Rhodospirillales bacterium]|nr:HNH endonuclease signature motif containing protein [Rhodospirillales bacterium]